MRDTSHCVSTKTPRSLQESGGSKEPGTPLTTCVVKKQPRIGLCPVRNEQTLVFQPARSDFPAGLRRERFRKAALCSSLFLQIRRVPCRGIPG